jgi:hypothetical protein
MAMIDPQSIEKKDIKYVCGYVAGLCDVLAQGWGTKGGGSLSMTTTMRVLQEVFGAEYGEELFHFADSCMKSKPHLFMDGLYAGGEDGNRFSEGSLPLNLVKYFQPRIVKGETKMKDDAILAGGGHIAGQTVGEVIKQALLNPDEITVKEFVQNEIKLNELFFVAINDRQDEFPLKAPRTYWAREYVLFLRTMLDVIEMSPEERDMYKKLMADFG